MPHPLTTRWFLALSLLGSAAFLQGCAAVKVSAIESSQFLADRRTDVLTHGELSASTRETLRIVGSEAKPCLVDAAACRTTVRDTLGLSDEQRLSALAELWAQEAVARGRLKDGETNQAWMEAARYAWAYLFFSERSPSERAFEDRQTQVRDYYNFATQQAVTGLFKIHQQFNHNASPDLDNVNGDQIEWQQWSLRIDVSDMYQATNQRLLRELTPASTLMFSGLRNTYRRDGFGAELVATFEPSAAHNTLSVAPPSAHQSKPWQALQPSRTTKSLAFEEARYPAITALLQFEGKTLEEVLNTRQVTVRILDPYQRSAVYLANREVPLAGNFTSGYGLWLARSEFATQALRTLFGIQQGIVAPRIHLMQPYDPNRRIVVMLHGLASSPEAWINVANEVLGDEQLRRNYQIWQVYYPTNAPIALNHLSIRQTLEKTLAHFDPQGTALASNNLTLVGHSMGGVLARLLVSDTHGKLAESVTAGLHLSPTAKRQLNTELSAMLEFAPLPTVRRAVFVAAPHRGTEFANYRLARWAANLITLPFSMVENMANTALLIATASAQSSKLGWQIPNSIDNLSDRDPYIRAVADLPIAPQVAYHSIIGNRTPELPLALSSDGIVPYTSAHLQGAASELVIPSGHSVQETPQAIVELRRILRAGLASPQASDPAAAQP